MTKQNENEQHPLEQERDALLEQAKDEPGVGEALQLQQAITQAAQLRETVALAYEPQGHYGTGFAQPS